MVCGLYPYPGCRVATRETTVHLTFVHRWDGSGPGRWPADVRCHAAVSLNGQNQGQHPLGTGTSERAGRDCERPAGLGEVVHEEDGAGSLGERGSQGGRQGSVPSSAFKR